MKQSPASEIRRKEKLFAAWNQYLEKVGSEIENDFDEIYEGLVAVYSISGELMDLRLDGDAGIRRIRTSPKISKASQVGDTMYIALGKQNDVWYPLDVISIGSIIMGRENQAHITFNPQITMQAPPSMTRH